MPGIKISNKILEIVEKNPDKFKPVVTDVSTMISPLGTKEACVRALEDNIRAEMSHVKNTNLGGAPSVDKFGE